MSDIQLGSLIKGSEQRDAIHVAIIPMEAADNLYPGQRVAIVRDGVAGPRGRHVGIVDPFLSGNVPKGAKFWLVLFPGTVTGMRHHWLHPDFESNPVDQRAASEAWLREAADTLGIEYSHILSDWFEPLTGDFINNGENIRNEWYEMQEEFLRHYNIVTGRNLNEFYGGFTCSC